MFDLFFVAENLGMTVTKMLTGVDQPMSIREFNYWKAYYNEKAAIEAKANKPKRSGIADVEFKKTMGNTQTPT